MSYFLDCENREDVRIIYLMVNPDGFQESDGETAVREIYSIIDNAYREGVGSVIISGDWMNLFKSGVPHNQIKLLQMGNNLYNHPGLLGIAAYAMVTSGHPVNALIRLLRRFHLGLRIHLFINRESAIAYIWELVQKGNS